jgi:hypothetical protein
VYEIKGIADMCERFCKENNACSIEITKHALNKEKGGQTIR